MALSFVIITYSFPDGGGRTTINVFLLALNVSPMWARKCSRSLKKDMTIFEIFIQFLNFYRSKNSQEWSWNGYHLYTGYCGLKTTYTEYKYLHLLVHQVLGVSSTMDTRQIMNTYLCSHYETFISIWIHNVQPHGHLHDVALRTSCDKNGSCPLSESVWIHIGVQCGVGVFKSV
jgi:hypothetical protein